MKIAQDYKKDIAEIREIMQRSSTFISLSGLSGIMVGLYALAGSYIAYRIVYIENSIMGSREFYVNEQQIILKLSIVALTVMIAAVATGLYLTARKNGRKKFNLSDPGLKNLLVHLAIPLLAGGAFILILVTRGYFGIVAPAFLIFYGLALVSASKYTLRDIKHLGLIEIILGLACALLPGYGLLFWAAGFGLMHILYGTIMYFKYER